ISSTSTTAGRSRRSGRTSSARRRTRTRSRDGASGWPGAPSTRLWSMKRRRRRNANDEGPCTARAGARGRGGARSSGGRRGVVEPPLVGGEGGRRRRQADDDRLGGVSRTEMGQAVRAAVEVQGRGEVRG